MSRVVDLCDLLAKAPRNCWLALNEDETEIVGRGETIEEALAEARNAGVEDPIVWWSPKEHLSVVYRG